MKFLFSHRNFPAQFIHIVQELAKDSQNEIVFITESKSNLNINGVKKYVYNLKRKVPKNCHSYLKIFEESVIHGQSAAEIAIHLKEKGFIPDVIFAHGWGNSMFFKDIFPDSPLLNYCEWFYNSENSDVDFVNKDLDINKKAMLRCKNAQFLIDLTACDKGISPTQWQKNQFPKIFHDKIEVLHDGVDTEFFKPDENAVLQIPNTGIKLSRKDKIVTYATRGMEAYRGFPEFMRMAEKLLKKRNDVHIVIGGEDRICYGAKLANGTYKEILLNELDLDMNRVHFTGSLPYDEYKKILQISSAHIYLTYPFVLSWSMLEAMSCGCVIIGSDTPPVQEVIKNNKNGFLTDFFDVDKLLEKTEYALDNPDEMQSIKNEARNTIVEKYNLKDLLPKQIELLKSLAKK